MQNSQTLLTEYGESHKNPINKIIHWFCVPTIVFSIVALLYTIKLPFYFSAQLQPNIALIILAIVLVYYIRLSVTLSFGFLFFSVFCLYICYIIESNDFNLTKTALLLFVVAWVLQFLGHKIEGAKPSFLKDIQFLMIGPAWLLHFIYKNLGIPF
jgi:uncharacterized membrane protein YGL010W